MTAGAVHGAEASQLPLIHYFDSVSSTFEEGWRLFREGRLGVWDSVIARSQTEGRGQLRKGWISPPGNLYWTVRLPWEKPFSTSGAAVALGALLANALRDLGCQALLKWPNDVVLRHGQGAAKVAGVLIEEREQCLLAGIGVNMANSPDRQQLAASHGMPATHLAANLPANTLPSPFQLGLQLLRHIRSACREIDVFERVWRDLASARLLWLGEPVIIEDRGNQSAGVFLGLGEDGCAQIENHGNVRDFYSGSMRAADAGRAEA